MLADPIAPVRIAQHIPAVDYGGNSFGDDSHGCVRHGAKALANLRETQPRAPRPPLMNAEASSPPTKLIPRTIALCVSACHSNLGEFSNARFLRPGCECGTGL